MSMIHRFVDRDKKLHRSKKYLCDALLEMHVTEKSHNQHNKYTFKFSPHVNKIDISNIIELNFGIKPEKINVMNCKPKAIVFKGRRGYTQRYKKAIITSSKKISIEENYGEVS